MAHTCYNYRGSGAVSVFTTRVYSGQERIMMKYSGREERETSTLNFDNFPMVVPLLFLACMCARCLDSSDVGLYIYITVAMTWK